MANCNKKCTEEITTQDPCGNPCDHLDKSLVLIKQYLDECNRAIYPVTSVDAVKIGDSSLSEYLSNFENRISQIIRELDALLNNDKVNINLQITDLRNEISKLNGRILGLAGNIGTLEECENACRTIQEQIIVIIDLLNQLLNNSGGSGGCILDFSEPKVSFSGRMVHSIWYDSEGTIHDEGSIPVLQPPLNSSTTHKFKVYKVTPGELITLNTIVTENWYTSVGTNTYKYIYFTAIPTDIEYSSYYYSNNTKMKTLSGVIKENVSSTMPEGNYSGMKIQIGNEAGRIAWALSYSVSIPNNVKFIGVLDFSDNNGSSTTNIVFDGCGDIDAISGGDSTTVVSGINEITVKGSDKNLYNSNTKKAVIPIVEVGNNSTYESDDNKFNIPTLRLFDNGIDTTLGSNIYYNNSINSFILPGFLPIHGYKRHDDPTIVGNTGYFLNESLDGLITEDPSGYPKINKLKLQKIGAIKDWELVSSDKNFDNHIFRLFDPDPLNDDTLTVETGGLFNGRDIGVDGKGDSSNHVVYFWKLPDNPENYRYKIRYTNRNNPSSQLYSVLAKIGDQGGLISLIQNFCEKNSGFTADDVYGNGINNYVITCASEDGYPCSDKYKEVIITVPPKSQVLCTCNHAFGASVVEYYPLQTVIRSTTVGDTTEIVLPPGETSFVASQDPTDIPDFDTYLPEEVNYTYDDGILTFSTDGVVTFTIPAGIIDDTQEAIHQYTLEDVAQTEIQLYTPFATTPSAVSIGTLQIQYYSSRSANQYSEIPLRDGMIFYEIDTARFMYRLNGIIYEC